MKVYIGYDQREKDAVAVARSSLWKTSSLTAELLDVDRLRQSGLLTRLTDKRGDTTYDLASNANASTDFAVSRFLVPTLCQNGWALFTDCDVVFLRNAHELLSLADKRYAVQVVKHNYEPSGTLKMDYQPQVPYSRKNWSSVMLFNCDHPANRRLSLHDVNNRRGLHLHQFYWLHHSEIGELPAEWNWLVGEQPRPENPAIAHFTLGVPSMKGYENCAHNELWWDEYRSLG